MSTYDYKKPTAEAISEVEAVRELFRKMHAALGLEEAEYALPRDPRCQAILRTKLEEACMYAVKAIVEMNHE